MRKGTLKLPRKKRSVLAEPVIKNDPKKREKKRIQQIIEEERANIFMNTCASYGLHPKREYVFLKDRKFRIDFYFEYGGKKLGLEVEGGVYVGGRHTSGAGFMKDMEKYNLFTMNDIYLYRTVPNDLNSIKVIRDILRFFGLGN